VPHPFMPLYFGSIQPGMLRRLLDRHAVDGIEMMSTVPIGPRRRRELEAFFLEHRDRLGAAVGGSDCHFGGHDLGRVLTVFEGDFRLAVESRTARPERGGVEGRIPISMAVRQQWRSLVELPLRRARRQL
jgi:hypothetical protein